MKEGLSGNIAKAFINSKLTILLMIGFLLIGGYSTLLIPREEEPQIDVPMADIFLRYPGASPKEVEARVSQPLEKIISNIKGVEYVYSTSLQGQAMIIVQFYVGEDIERSLVKLYNELMKNMDKMPAGVMMPLVKTRAIDDVPVLGLTLWSGVYNDYDLKQLGTNASSSMRRNRRSRPRRSRSRGPDAWVWHTDQPIPPLPAVRRYVGTTAQVSNTVSNGALATAAAPASLGRT